MIARATKALADRPNAHVYQNNGKDLNVIPASDFDFAFSTIVFQHIPSREVIETYVREVSRLLRPGALFKFQVQGDCTLETTPDDTTLSSWSRTAVLLAVVLQEVESGGCILLAAQ
jgi:hypothetical protein